MEDPFAIGNVVGSYINPNESYVVLEIGTGGRMILVRSSDGKEIWMSKAVAKPIAQDPVTK